MKKILFSLLALFALVSCSDKNDDTPITYTPEEAKASVQNAMDSFYDCLKKANDGGFANFFYEAMFKKLGQDETWFYHLGDAFYEDYELNKDNGFNYNGLKGTYTWNSATQRWDKSGTNNNIVWIFPATASSTTNDGRILIENYEDIELTSKKGGIQKLPVKGHGVVTVAGQKLLEVTLSNITYQQNANFFVPTAMDLTIFANPFTATVKLVKQDAQNFAFNFLFSSPQGCTTGIRVQAKLSSADYDSFATFEEAVDNLHVVAVQNDLQLVAQADVKGIHKAVGKKITNLTVEETNTYIKAEVYKNAVKIADVKMDKENGKEVFYLIFSDGSKEKAEKYIANFEKRMEEIFKRFLD